MPLSEKIKILIIDDEREACENLMHLLSEYGATDIDIMGMAHDTVAAERLISELKPDVVFMDIEMPDENAFQFLERVHPINFELVFVTAYDEYAIRAFKLNAIDYILKPICIDEIEGTISKLRERMGYKAINNDAAHQLKTLKQIAQKEPQNKIVLRALNNIEVVDLRNISYIEGKGSYCKVFFNKEESIHEITMSTIISEYEEMLPKDVFYRIHKSYMINCNHISKITHDHQYEVILKNNIAIPVSRRRHADFIAFLKQHNFPIE